LTNIVKHSIIIKLKEEVIHFSPYPNKEKGYKMSFYTIAIVIGEM
jgi:hypothetical protein